uniref:Uncharacterized protein n=1 Tax=Acrobeloides nanus TaxID=290746 RepID=A0A914EM05_9BILA
MNVLKYFRGWIAITMIQCAGMILENVRSPESFAKAFMRNAKIPTDLNNVISRIFLMKCVQDLLIKGFLIIGFHNPALHGLHVLSNLLYLVYFLTEICYFELFKMSVPSITQVIMSGLSITFTLVLWKKISEPEEIKVEQRPKPRKLIAKHYMENQVQDYVTEPKKLK